MDRTSHRTRIDSTFRRHLLRLLGGSFVGGFAVAAGISASTGTPVHPGRRAVRFSGERIAGPRHDRRPRLDRPPTP